jgi:ubiquinone biosynthesis protein
MGSLPERDQYWLAENFMAMFDRDYKRIAELHLAAGWVPAHVRVDELEAAVRTVCEPYFSRPLAEISLGEVVAKMFSVARRYELTLQPQLILLQKTLLNIEGMGRLLHPRIDIWATAKPVLSEILRHRYGVRRMLRVLRSRLPEWLAAAPEMPQLVHTFLKKAAAGDFDARHSADASASTATATRVASRNLILAVLGATSLLIAAMLYLYSRPSASAVAALVAAGAFVFAWRRSR